MSRVISADVPDDLAEQIEDEQEEGESRSACVRRLLREGLDAETGPQAPLTAYWLLGAGLFLFTSAYVEATPRNLVGGTGIVFILLAAALSNERIRHTLTALRRKTAELTSQLSHNESD